MKKKKLQIDLEKIQNIRERIDRHKKIIKQIHKQMNR